MNTDVLTVVQPGFALTLQDRGRHGWRRFGVPPGGAMDEHAAAWANRLLDNPPGAPVLEILLQGARLVALRDVWIAVTGADAQCNVPRWRAVRVAARETVEFPRHCSGLWAYLAVEDGFAAEPWLGSVSAYARAGLGAILREGDVLSKVAGKSFCLPPGVASRMVPPLERRRYDSPPTLRVWPAPQTEQFSAEDRKRFFSEPWTVSSQSDRVGYRLMGRALNSQLPQIISEPVRVGTVQVPENGLPIVTMRDGPTVGGYPKIGLLEPSDVSWLAQCSPGQTIRFQPAHEA
jgi:biotin-dependent carboxylase-like uncharacterized protein